MDLTSATFCIGISAVIVFGGKPELRLKCFAAYHTPPSSDGGIDKNR